MHKLAKELLYAEIERNSQFQGKFASGEVMTEKLIQRADYRDECVLMEFVSAVEPPHYPDETLCRWYGCNGAPPDDRPTTHGRFNDGNGYCACASCKWLLPREKYIVHDIAAFWKGMVGWAVEIVHKHTPDWAGQICLEYPVYIVKAENVLKRTTDTPVFIEDFIYRRG